MKIILLILFPTLSSFVVHAQLFMIGKTRQEIKEYFTTDEKDYIYKGEKSSNDGTPYIEFDLKESINDIIAYYFNDDKKCFMVLITESKEQLSSALKAMNKNYINTGNLTWINESGTTTYKLSQKPTNDFFEILATSVSK